MGKGVKRFKLAVKTSVNYPRALIGVVTGSHRASTFFQVDPQVFLCDFGKIIFFLLFKSCGIPLALKLKGFGESCIG